MVDTTYALVRRNPKGGAPASQTHQLDVSTAMALPYPWSPLAGQGYLAGEFPGGTTTVEGAPVSAAVRILYRPAAGALGDGVVVTEVQSALDGTWRVDGLNPALKYDVVGRKNGHNDVIMANVTPTSMVDITYYGAVFENETFTGALGYLELVGGIPPYEASVVDPLPAGIFPVLNGRQLIIDGITTDDDVFNSTVRITSSNGATKDVPVKLVVGFKAPANLEAEALEDAGAFSVLLTWEVTNTTQEVLVFRSTTPFDLESMPAPIATLTGDAVSYTDDDVIEHDVFYYMTASVCEGFTLYSDGVEVVVFIVPLLPTAIGEFFQGGYYIGDITVADGNMDDGTYAIIMAVAEVNVKLKLYQTLTEGTDSLTNGMANTIAMQVSGISEQPAGNFCLNYVNEGYDDWYLPSRSELNLAWINLSSLSLLGLLVNGLNYWSSTQRDQWQNWIQKFDNGAIGSSTKYNTNRVRPVRRIRKN